VRSLRERAAALQERSGARERELDLVAFELEEIESVDPSEPEQQQLLAERDRLRHVEALRLGAAAGAEALVPEEGGGATAALAQAVAQLEPLAGIDPELAPLLERLRTVRYEAEDLGSELRRYLLELDAEPGRLEEVEERLGAFARLERKHGGSIAEVLRHAERCRARRDELQNADVALEAAQAELDTAQQTLDELASELSARRRKAAPLLAGAVRSRLGELAMTDAEFEVEIRAREEGCGPRGRDAVEFRIAPNPGMPAGPLREIASGGELSRLMLALFSVAHGAGSGEAEDERRDGALLVFDEVDAGIGGHTARAVGEHLRALARERQILCITHLPQVAAVASRHFTIVKDSSRTPAHTEVMALDGEAVVGELVRMLGAGKDDSAASEHARQLLHAA
jgi:DNA repair protein RecN (Recombination protein N)